MFYNPTGKLSPSPGIPILVLFFYGLFSPPTLTSSPFSLLPSLLSSFLVFLSSLLNVTFFLQSSGVLCCFSLGCWKVWFQILGPFLPFCYGILWHTGISGICICPCSKAWLATLLPIKPMYHNCTFSHWKLNDEANRAPAENRCSYSGQMLHMPPICWS